MNMKVKLLFFLFVFFELFFLPSHTFAQTGNDLTDFHSLRPNPGEPTGKPSSVRICGASIFFQDSVTGVYSPNSCTANSGGYYCEFTQQNSITVSIDLSQSKLPIMGNTEDVVNKINSTDLIDDAEKTNEYVSWYLNGITGRAEYNFPDPNNPEDVRKIVDFSGPLKKLLPQEGQNIARIEIIDRANNNEIYDQVVACTNILQNPVACYTLFRDRLTEWAKDSSRKPPLSEAYEKFRKYYIAYKRWRGYSCVNLLGTVVCLDTPWKFNKWSDIFPYIPFSSTEDKEGSIEYEFVEDQSSNDVEIKVEGFPVGSDSVVLSFPHMQESFETASLLQKTFVPSSLSVNEIMGQNMPDVDPAYTDSECKVYESRTSPGGDRLYPKENTLEARLTYTAKFNCDFTFEQVQNSPQSATCTKEFEIEIGTATETPLANQVWSKLVSGSNAVFRRIFPKIGTENNLGNMKDIPTSTLVNYSVTQSDSGSGTITDAPANLYFAHIGAVSEYFLKGIQTILRPKGFGDFTFPKQSYQVGLWQDYMFLKEEGRPANQDVVYYTTPPFTYSETCDIDPSYANATGLLKRFIQIACSWLNGGKPRIDKFDQVVSAAEAKGVDPIFVLALWIHESGASNYAGIYNRWGYHYVQDFGYNKPNYETRFGDWGEPITADRFDLQLTSFLELPGYYKYRCPWNGYEPMDMFFSQYGYGLCVPNANSIEYKNAVLTVYSWLAPGQPFPTYPTRVE